MKNWRKKFAVLLLLLLPLQALAASLSVLTCYTGEAHHGIVDHAGSGHGSSHEDGTHYHGAPHPHDVKIDNWN